MGEDENEDFLARMLPRKANRWIWPTIGMEFVTNVLEAATAAARDATTVFSQRFNYHDERQNFLSDIDRDLEALDQGADMATVSMDADDEDDWDEDEE